MKAYLLVEGSSDRAFFRRILPPDIQAETIIVMAGGRSNITSKARSLMVTKRRPVALVTDADAVEKDAVEQRLKTLEDLVGTATTGVPYKVILAVPEIESSLFLVPQVLERLSGQKLSPEQRELGEVRPKEILRQLFKNTGAVTVDELANELTRQEIETLQEFQPWKDLIGFLTDQVHKKTEPQLA